MNLLLFLGVSAFVISVSNGYWELIVAQKPGKLFNSSIRTIGLENEHDPDADTYCIVGLFDEEKQAMYKNINITKSPYQYYQNDVFKFKLVYQNVAAPDNELIWTQTSWLTESTITGANLTLIPEQDVNGVENRRFEGLGLSNSENNVWFDSNGGKSHWWGAVGQYQYNRWRGCSDCNPQSDTNAVPGFFPNIAESMQLYIENGKSEGLRDITEPVLATISTDELITDQIICDGDFTEVAALLNGADVEWEGSAGCHINYGPGEHKVDSSDLELLDSYSIEMIQDIITIKLSGTQYSCWFTGECSNVNTTCSAATITMNGTLSECEHL